MGGGMGDVTRRTWKGHEGSSHTIKEEMAAGQQHAEVHAPVFPTLPALGLAPKETHFII